MEQMPDPNPPAPEPEKLPESTPPPDPLPQGARDKQEKGPWAALLGLLYLACLAAGIAVFVAGPKAPSPEPPKATTAKSLFNLDLGKENAIGIVRIEGVISMNRDGGFFFGSSNMVERVEKDLERLAKKKQVKAIILRINSPGGTVASSQEIYRIIRQLKEKHKKPIVAFMGDVAASGGYYVASACDAIVAAPGTLTGSIGVIFQTMHYDQLAQRFGVHFNTIKSGKFKDIGNPARPMLPEERELLQNLISAAYDQFVQAISDGRKMPIEKVRELADGRIYIAEQAVNKGLIDSIGGFEDAVQKAKALGGIQGEHRFLEEGDLRETIFNEILKEGGGSRMRRLEQLLPLSGLLYVWPAVLQ